MFRRVTKRHNELTEEIADASVRYIGRGGIKCESPGQWVSQGFFKLVCFEMLVPNSLLVDSHTFDGASAVRLAKPAGVELIIGHYKEKDHANGGGQEAVD